MHHARPRAFLAISAFLSAVLVTPWPSFAATDPYEGKPENNGYKLTDFTGFPEQWEFVTVRYRHDTTEMRFTYANKLAADALRKGSKDYPDGAIFGKVGRKSAPDPAFTSSAVPSGAKRFQFMVRDRKKFKDTDGWGYVLFDANGVTFPGEPKVAAQACAACHRIVKDRGFVFSQFMDVGVKPQALAKETTGSLKFEKVKVATLPESVRKWIPTNDQEVMSLQGEMRKHLFQGTLDEIVPLLTEQLTATKLPAILLSEDEQRFSLVIRDRTSKTCGDKMPLLSVRVAPELPRGLLKKAFCN